MTNATPTSTAHFQKHKIISIEVCQGPDCTGLGGGAAILEIEELVQEAQCQDRYQYDKNKQNDDQDKEQLVSRKPTMMCTLAGGCRDFCTVGPNVRILKQCGATNSGTSRSKKPLVLESFHHVNDITSCRKVVESATSFIEKGAEDHEEQCRDRSHDSPNTNVNNSNHSHQSMMSRRAERIRWEALKHISRTIAKCKKAAESACEESDTVTTSLLNKTQRSKESCHEQLSSAHRAELSAARGVSANVEREKRRFERLTHAAENGLQKCLQMFQDEEDESVSDDNDDE